MLEKIIQQTVEGKAHGTRMAPNSEEAKQLSAEVDVLFINRARAVSMLDKLFPTGVPDDISFFERLNDLHRRLGWTDTSHRLTGLFLLLAVERFSVNLGEKLLDQVPCIKNPYFFQTLESLAVLMAERPLRPEFAAKWLPALVRRIGNDLAPGGFWKSLATFCERQTAHALQALRSLSAGQSEEEIAVAAYILGTIRRLEGVDLVDFQNLENEFSTTPAIGTKAIVNRSWIQTAWRGKMQKEDLASLVDRLGHGSVEEREQALWITCKSLLTPVITSDCFDFGMNWLKENVSASLSPTAKHHIVEFAVHLSPARCKEVSALVLLIQPISSEHKGTWSSLEFFLVPWLQSDAPGFCDFCFELAKSNAREWLKVLKAPQSFDWFLSELPAIDVGHLVGRLVLSTSASCRKLGLFLFDELNMSTLPTSMLEEVGEDSVKIAFYEFQRGLMDGHALARYMIMLIPCIQRTDGDFQGEFSDELLRQLKNYGGACHEEFLRKADEFPLLRETLKKADAYFDALKTLHQSSIKSMQVAGYHKAARIHARKMSNEISKGVNENSLIKMLAKTVRLLYGRSWSSFNEGKLGDTSTLKRFSSSFEIPRLEIIDPEGMALRRLYASSKLLELAHGAHCEEEEA